MTPRRYKRLLRRYERQLASHLLTAGRRAAAGYDQEAAASLRAAQVVRSGIERLKSEYEKDSP